MKKKGESCPVYKGLLEKFSNEHTEVTARAAGGRAASPNSSDRSVGNVSKAKSAKDKKSFITMLSTRRQKRRHGSTTRPSPGRSQTLLVFPQHVRVSLSREINISLDRI